MGQDVVAIREEMGRRSSERGGRVCTDLAHRRQESGELHHGTVERAGWVEGLGPCVLCLEFRVGGSDRHA
jgi:hypothetical protein